MSTRAAPEVEAAFRLQAQTARLNTIETDLQSRRFSIVDHPIVANAAANVPRAITMLVDNARATFHGNRDTFEALTQIANKYPDHAVSVVSGIAQIGGSEAALALKNFPKARNETDADAYVGAVNASRDRFPPRTVELVFSAITHKNPSVGCKAISALIDMDTDFAIQEAITLTYDKADRTAHLLPLLAAKPGNELPVVALYERDTKGFLSVETYVAALSDFATDQAADCLSTMAAGAKNHHVTEACVHGLKAIGSDHAVELLSDLAVGGTAERLTVVTALFDLRRTAADGGRQDLEIYDYALRRSLNGAMNLGEIDKIVRTDAVSEFRQAFAAADALKIGRQGDTTYTDLFRRGLDLVHSERRLNQAMGDFTRPEPALTRQ